MKNIQIISNRPSPYVVYFTVDGVKHRKSFSSLSDAKDYARQFRRRKMELGIDALVFLPEEKADYKTTLALAIQHGFKTTTAFVQSLMRSKEPQPVSTKTIQEALEEYISYKQSQGRSEHTVSGARIRVGAFCRLVGNLALSDVTQAHIEAFCLSGELSPRTRRNNFQEVMSFLYFCKRRKYTQMDLNIDRRSILPRELKKAKPVFSLSEVKTLLDTLQGSERFRKFIPFFALQLFCGIRRAEAERMRWRFVNASKREIRLPAEITKTGDEHILRAPFLPSTVFAWLAPFVPREDAPIPFPGDTIRQELVRLLGKWERNGCRHTFATMHVSLYGDTAKTALLLRHRNQQRLWQNYLATLVPEEEAREYFALAPRKEASNG